MKRLFPGCFTICSAFALLLASLSPGCGKKAASASTSAPDLSVQPEQGNLQTELDRLSAIPHEHDPKKRPVVLSDPSTNRHDWVLQVLERGYVDSGHSSGRWDAPVHRAFQGYVDYSRAGMTDEHFSNLSNAVSLATAAGCDDPMIQYMHLRYGLGGFSNSKEEFARAYLSVFRKVYLSHHHPLLKFYVGHRAIEAAREADAKGNRSGFLELVTGTLEDLVHDTNAPAGEVFDAVFTWVDYTKGKGWADYVMTDVQPNLEKRWGNEEAFFRLRGKLEVSRAWEARGGGFANTVSEQGFEGFRDHLDQAERFLSKAWQMDSSNAYTAYLMMQSELGQGQGRQRMETWFGRAMNLAPAYYDAAILMSFYLEPRWYGSEADALEFARTCVTSTNWTGQVPLVLPKTHHSLATYSKLAESVEYWQRPGVWEDVRDGYEKFFKLNPNDYSWRHDYAKDAFLCGHLDVFLAQTRLFASGTNFTFFGGKEKFDQMLAQASRAAKN